MRLPIAYGSSKLPTQNVSVGMRTHFAKRVVSGVLLCALFALFAVITVRYADAQTQPPPSSSVQSDGAGWGQMTPERRAQAISYSNTKHILYFVDFFFGVAVWLGILYSGLSAKLLA